MKYFIILLFIIAILSITNASALDKGLCVEAEISDISPSSIGIDKEFTVGIHIENCGEEIPKNISFEIISVPPDITIKEPLVTYIPKLQYANSERFLNYHMKTTNDAKPGIHIIKTKLVYGNQEFTINKDYNITIDVIAEEAELSIASVKTKPVLPYEEEIVELTLRIENFGDGIANSVKVYVQHPFQGVKESFIGTLDPDEDGPGVFTFISSESGEFEIPVKISYEDDFGENEIETKINLIVLKKKTNWGIIFLSLVIISIITWLIFYYFKTKKEKDRVIQQLLKGNNLIGISKKSLHKK